MEYAVTFTNNYGRVSVGYINAFHTIEVSVIISTESKAKAYNALSQAKALFI